MPDDTLSAGAMVIVCLRRRDVGCMNADGDHNGCDQGQQSGDRVASLGYAQTQSHLHPSI